MADEIKYEYKTVKTVRGMDSRTISKMQEDGWELTEQVPGTLRTTLTFRRPKKPLPRFLIGTGAAVLLLLAVVIGVASALSGGEEKKDESGKSTAAGAKTSAAPKPTLTPTKIESTAAEVITSQNSSKFAALLKTADHCDEANLDFATKHKGQKIAFDGSIVDMAPHGDYDTRYDLLLGPGDEGPQTADGPAFKYEDVNVFDLKLTGKRVPATVGEGDKFRFVAEVSEFNPIQCLFYLVPVSTKVR